MHRMSHARRPKQYPSGPAQPVTKAWKQRVLSTLHANRAAGRSPSTPSELARVVGADKAGLIEMLKGDQATSRYARQICDVLGIEPAMVINPSIENEELETAIAALRALPPARQRRALSILETLLKPLDDE